MWSVTTETLRIALRSLVRNPWRSGLTVLGLSIGVAAFIAMVSFGQGARSSVVEQFQKFGINVLTIKTESIYGAGRRAHPLDDRDVARLQRDASTLELVVPLVDRAFLVTRGEARHLGPIIGTVPEFVDLRDWSFRSGGMFDARDMAERAQVCVLGATPAEALFPGEEAVGQIISSDGLRCRVIGVLAAKGTATSGRDLDDVILLPVSTFRARLVDRRVFRFIEVRPRDPGLQEAAKAEIASILRTTHAVVEEDDFSIRSPDDATRVADEVARILTGLLAGIAAVSLIVGGIGIMNIQLVAVAERTQEIGIRSALGASPQQILLQFLSEAVLLALVGAALGALAGTGVAVGVAHAMKWPPHLPLGPVLIAIAFGGGVGVLFGFLPARRAAALDPIEALRRE